MMFHLEGVRALQRLPAGKAKILFSEQFPLEVALAVVRRALLQIVAPAEPDGKFPWPQEDAVAEAQQPVAVEVEAREVDSRLLGVPQVPEDPEPSTQAFRIKLWERVVRVESVQRWSMVQTAPPILAKEGEAHRHNQLLEPVVGLVGPA